MSATIREIAVTVSTRRSGRIRPRETREETICLKTTGGSIFLRQSAVEGAGSSWALLLRRLKNTAAELQIPFTDTRQN